MHGCLGIHVDAELLVIGKLFFAALGEFLRDWKPCWWVDCIVISSIATGASLFNCLFVSSLWVPPTYRDDEALSNLRNQPVH